MNVLYKPFISISRNIISRVPKLLYSSKKSEQCLMMDPENKIALITGGCGEVGFAVAQELLKQKVKSVALLDINPDCGLKTVNNISCLHGSDKAIFIKCDVSKKKCVQECFKSLSTCYGKIDILINAAGVWNDLEWENEMNTNLVGVINTNIVAPGYMNQNGIIINISGTNAFQAQSHSPTLSASYSGIVAASRCFGHRENTKENEIRIVCLCLGLTKTQFILDAETKQLNSEMGRDLKFFLESCPSQTPDPLKVGIVHIIKYAKTGSVWIADTNKLYSLVLPNWKCLANVERKYTE